MWIGWIQLDILLGDVHSLKAKRSVIRPIIAELKNKFQVAAAETGEQDLYRRAEIGASSVASQREFLVKLFDDIDESLMMHPEVTVLSSRVRIIRAEDVD